MPSGSIRADVEAFNVAASIKMRNFARHQCMCQPSRGCLQCGRIYKDAEINLEPEIETLEQTILQCGRIYKDAEMRERHVPMDGGSVSLQCGRIYKDAEIGVCTFRNRGAQIILQCGRIYKDAEIVMR